VIRNGVMSKQAKTQRVHVPAHDYDMPLKTYRLQCAWCGKDATVTTYPGRPPRFCSTDCATEARKAHDRARKAAGQPAAPDITPDGRRRRGRPQKYPRLSLSAAPGAPEPIWPYLAPDLPLSPRDAALAAAEARTRLRARREVLMRATQVNKTTAQAALDELEAALVVWRPMFVRRALLEELARSIGLPDEARMAATLELALVTVRDPAWPAAIQQLRALVASEGRIRRQGDLAQLLQLVTTVADHLSTAEGGSEQAWGQVIARQQLWAPAATWLERGLGALVHGSSPAPPATSSPPPAPRPPAPAPPRSSSTPPPVAPSPWGDLNPRQQAYLEIAYDVDQAAEALRRSEAAAGQWSKTPAAVWRWLMYGPTSPESTLYDRLRGRGLVDPGTGATWEALETRGLVECRHTPTADGGRLLEIKLTPKGRKLVRTATAEIRTPVRKKGQLRPRQWAALVQLYTAGTAGLPAAVLDRQFDWWYTSLRLRNLGYFEEYETSPSAEQRYWRRITAAGQAHYDEWWATYQERYPEVEAPPPAIEQILE
jgi:hypothetical protein